MGASLEIKANARRGTDGDFLDGQSQKNGMPVVQAPGHYFAGDQR